MAAFPTADVDHTFQSISHIHQAQANEERLYAADDADTSSSEDAMEEIADSPVYDAFFDKEGSSVIAKMTSLTSTKLLDLWSLFSEFIISKWSSGRGRKPNTSAKDAFFVMLCVLKHGGDWDFLGTMFRLKGLTFERTMTRYMDVGSDQFFDILVLENHKYWTIAKLREQGYSFKHFKAARYATDVTSQMANRPRGNLQESKSYFSGKPKLYGYKVEVSVMSNGLAVMCSAHYPCATSDLQISREMKDSHEVVLKKADGIDTMLDNDPLRATFPNCWAVLADKGYQGAQNVMRVIHPKKKPSGRSLSAAAEEFNRKVLSDRVIVENYFRPMCTFWKVVSLKYKWSEGKYETIFNLCVALTNFHIEHHALRDGDAKTWHTYNRRAVQIGRGNAI